MQEENNVQFLLLRQKKHWNRRKEGDLVIVLVDNEIAIQNLQKLATQKNAGFQWKKNGDSEYEAVFAVGNSDLAQEEELEISCEMPTSTRKKKIVVAVASNQMGVGEEALGKTIIKGISLCINPAGMFCLIRFYSIMEELVFRVKVRILWKI